ncbi:hypothetical protein BH11BAC2_BH11BAC2_11140 [soil metagenome]
MLSSTKNLWLAAKYKDESKGNNSEQLFFFTALITLE